MNKVFLIANKKTKFVSATNPSVSSAFEFYSGVDQEVKVVFKLEKIYIFKMLSFPYFNESIFFAEKDSFYESK